MRCLNRCRAPCTAHPRVPPLSPSTHPPPTTTHLPPPQTLSDPDKRAAYDAIVGFQIGGVNPFTDTSYERDSVFVDEFTCIGCKNCNCVASATFMMEDEWGRARVRQQGVDGVEKLQEAIDTCPVSCIHWVSTAARSAEPAPRWGCRGGGGGSPATPHTCRSASQQGCLATAWGHVGLPGRRPPATPPLAVSCCR